jgi:hypothetical protein
VQQAAAAAAAQPGFDVDAELDRLGLEEKSLRESARRKVRIACSCGRRQWSDVSACSRNCSHKSRTPIA